jgi:hypothetical protein
VVSDAQVVEFSQLAGSDLVFGRINRGGAVGGTGDHPLSKLLRVGNQSGFRPAGSPKKDSVTCPTADGALELDPVRIDVRFG